MTEPTPWLLAAVCPYCHKRFDFNVVGIGMAGVCTPRCCGKPASFETDGHKVRMWKFKAKA